VALRDIAGRLDSGTLLYDIQPLDHVREGALATPRLMAYVLGLFAAVAAAISLAGVAGVSAYTAARRTREMALRLCVDAEPRAVFAMLLRQSLSPVAIGASAWRSP
jgi:putative ABC transport system permease protein